MYKRIAAKMQERNIMLARLHFVTSVMTLNFDLWPWEPFQQLPLTWWRSVPSFTEIPPLLEEITSHKMAASGQFPFRAIIPIPTCSAAHVHSHSAQQYLFPLAVPLMFIPIPRSNIYSHLQCSSCSFPFRAAIPIPTCSAAHVHSHSAQQYLFPLAVPLMFIPILRSNTYSHLQCRSCSFPFVSNFWTQFPIRPMRIPTSHTCNSNDSHNRMRHAEILHNTAPTLSIQYAGLHNTVHCLLSWPHENTEGWLSVGMGFWVPFHPITVQQFPFPNHIGS